MLKRDDLKSATGVTHLRLLEEVSELSDAISLGDDAKILDELVDVNYYVRRLAACRGISEDILARYSLAKSALRESGVRNKNLEARIALEMLTD